MTDAFDSTTCYRRTDLEIYQGKLDGHLSALAAAIRDRQKAIAQRDMGSLQPGDMVAFTGKIRPAYLAGLTATVVRVNQTTVTVSVPRAPAYGRFSGSPALRCPLTLVQRLTPFCEAVLRAAEASQEVAR